MLPLENVSATLTFEPMTLETSSSTHHIHIKFTRFLWLTLTFGY